MSRNKVTPINHNKNNTRAACSRVLARLASLAQIGELARRLCSYYRRQSAPESLLAGYVLIDFNTGEIIL